MILAVGHSTRSFSPALKRRANVHFSSGKRKCADATAAFTLIELILVMTLMAILASFALPSLSHFFRGREVNSETFQLLSLTHEAQSRAVSEGFPMLLWIDTQDRSYGLTAETTTQRGNSDVDPKAEDFAFSDKVQVDAPNATAIQVNGKNLPAIRFLPDGTIDETSPPGIRVMGLSGEVMWLMQATNHLQYAVTSGN